MHTSRRMKEADYDYYKDFMLDTISGANIDNGEVRVGAVIYRKKGSVVFPLNRYRSRNNLEDAINRLPFQPGTYSNLASGMDVVRENLFTPDAGDREDVPNAVIVVTDSDSTSDVDRIPESARKLKDAGVEIFTAGIGLDTSGELPALASGGDSGVLAANSVRGLTPMRDEIVLQIPALRRRFKDVFLPTWEDPKKLDLAFLIHTSKKVDQETFQQYKDFMRDTVSEADIESGAVQVGAVLYRKRGSVLFPLNRYNTKGDLNSGINGLKLQRAKDNSLAVGMDTVRENFFTPEQGDREDAPNVVIVLTDEDPTIDVAEIPAAAQMLKDQSRARVFAAGVGLNKDDLKDVASNDDGLFTPSTFDELSVVKDKIVKQVEPLGQKDDPSGSKGLTVDDTDKADVAIVFHLSQKTIVKEISDYFVPFVSSLLEKAKIDNGDVRVSLTNFAKRPRIRFNLNTYDKAEPIMNEIKKIGRRDRARQSFGANALRGIRSTVFTPERGDRPDVPNAIILVTNNENQQKLKGYAQEAETLKKDGVKIITVGIGEDVNENELNAVASPPLDENVIMLKGMQALEDPSVPEDVRSGILGLMGYPATPAPPPLWSSTGGPDMESTVNMTASQPGVLLSTSVSNVHPPLTTNLPEPVEADIVFLVHFSKSSDDYDQLINFMKDSVETSDVDGGIAQFGVYYDRGMVPFHLNRYTSNQEVADALDQMPRNTDATMFDLAGGLRYIRDRMFVPERGDREDAPNKIIVVTDTNAGQDPRQLQREKDANDLAGIDVYTVGVNVRDKGELEDVSSGPDNVFAFAGYPALGENGDLVKRDIPAMNTRQPRPKPSTTVATTQCDAPVDLVFAFQQSKLTSGENFRSMVEFSKEFVFHTHAIDTHQIRVGAVSFPSSRLVYEEFTLEEGHRRHIAYWNLDRIRNYPTDKTSRPYQKNVFDYIVSNIQWRKDTLMRRIVLVLMSRGLGRHLKEAHELHLASSSAKASGVQVYVIGVGTDLTFDLPRLASHPWRANSVVLDSFEQFYHVKPSSISMCKGRLHRPSSRPDIFQSCSDAKIDLVFVLDASTSVTEPNFELMKDFVKDFLYEADIDGGNVRVGVIIYSTQDHVEFQMNTYRTKADVYNAVDEIPYRYGSTNTADALKTMRTQMFTRANGDRPGVENICIVVTDGVSNINARRTIPEAEQARGEGIHIYAIGIGLSDTRELDGIASKPVEENRFAVQEFSELRDLRHKVFSALCKYFANI
ncbi:collagen alpha-3(VI) chain [Elysia marginata]|uniref:Collagen alpha-3(VI) chain n=1 Tax=Elysia marginata TaxID=1093978 RepID=A0AAV4FYP9_9GAST|nr:collagen alpha-3(VI) chain [Elysia marginata]